MSETATALRVALVTHDDTDLARVGGIDPDLPFLLDALAERGLSAETVPWRRADLDWAAFDLVVIRSPWDYPDHAEEFLGWLATVERQTRVLNDPELIRWNIDKVYLHDIAAVSSVPIVPTVFCGTVEEFDAAVTTVDSERIVVKPSVSAGSRDTGLFERNDPAASRLATHIVALGKTVMLQPAIASVQSHGENALLYVDGHFSHSINKGPLLAVGGGLKDGQYVEAITPRSADDAEIAVADELIAAVATVLQQRGLDVERSTPLYARIDLVHDELAGPLVLEAELFEPSLFIDSDEGAAARFASAVEARLLGGTGNR